MNGHIGSTDPRSDWRRRAEGATAAALLVLLAACGGGSGGGSSSEATPTVSAGADPATGVGAGATAGSTAGPTAGTGGGSGNSAAVPPAGPAGPTNTALSASRFLAQASYGPTDAEIAHLSTTTYAAWIEEQFAKPRISHRDTLSVVTADLVANGGQVSQDNFFDSYWSQAIAGDDQLRQRATFALSQIFVISFTDPTLRNQPRGVASYYDMLAANAFGNFRDLLEGVALHPMMGIYLSHLKNQKEDPATGRTPDLNFAREVTQLFTIGQVLLNRDGTSITGPDGKPAPAYTSADLGGLAQVFTGWSWYAGATPGNRTRNRFFGNDAVSGRDWQPMQDYNHFAPNTDFHSISEKRFFGVTIPAQALETADTRGDLKIALDTLFNHPNVGPFIGRQLIQRLVTSNPSPAYIGRVSAAFNDNGAGQRGDMKAVWRAVLLDPEARTVPAGDAATRTGKLREPLLRLGNFMRAFHATSNGGNFTGIGNTDDPSNRLNQTVMFAPTVFNFFRPGYVPAGRAIADAGLVAPELQLVHDVSVAGYLNYLQRMVTVDTNRDIQQNYTAELALADKPAELVERMNLLLFNGMLPDALRAQLVTAVTSRTIPAPVFAAPTTAAGGNLTKLADEGGNFNVTGSGAVRYGAGTTFIEKTVSGAGQCSNDFFGNDPLVGTGKACFLFTPTPTPGAGAPAPAPPPPVASNQGAIDAARRDRVYLAVYLSMAAPDYLIQK